MGELMLPDGHFRWDGRLIYGMASTGQNGLVGPWRGLSRETRDDPGERVSLPDHR